jgi:hypothetical protein
MDEPRQGVAEYYRRLDEGPGPFAYHHFPDAGLDGSRYWFKSAEDQGELIAIRQVQIGADGLIHRYWCERLDDEAGFLTDRALHPDIEDDLVPISQEVFESIWNSPGGES